MRFNLGLEILLFDPNSSNSLAAFNNSFNLGLEILLFDPRQI